MKTAALLLLAVAGIIVAVSVYVRYAAGSFGTITSWWRSPWHNAEVGGLAGSAHLIGWAADLVSVSPDDEDRLRQTFPVVVNEGNHIHVALFRA